MAAAELSEKRKVGLRMRALREAHGLTRTQLAYDAGVSRAYLTDLEAGRTNPSVANVGKLARCMGYGLADFFDDDVFRLSGKFAGSGVDSIPRARVDMGERAASVDALLEMPYDERVVLAAVRDDPSVTIAGIARSSGISRSSVQRTLARLADEGRVRRVGPKRGGRWEVMGA